MYNYRYFYTFDKKALQYRRTLKTKAVFYVNKSRLESFIFALSAVKPLKTDRKFYFIFNKAIFQRGLFPKYFK